MLDAVVDHQIAILVALLAGILVLGARFRATGNRRLLGGAAFLLACMPAVIALGFVVQTPSRQIQSLLDHLVGAMERRDADTVAAAIARDYNHGGHTYQSLAGLIRGELNSVSNLALQLNGTQIEANRDQATAKFVAMAAGTYQGHSVQRYPVRLKLTFQRQPDGWKIVQIQRFEPITNTSQEIPLAHH